MGIDSYGLAAAAAATAAAAVMVVDAVGGVVVELGSSEEGRGEDGSGGRGKTRLMML
jgi:hypothetical protein